MQYHYANSLHASGRPVVVNKSKVIHATLHEHYTNTPATPTPHPVRTATIIHVKQDTRGNE